MLSLSRSSAVALLGAIFLSTPLQAATLPAAEPLFGYNNHISVKALYCKLGGGPSGLDCVRPATSTSGNAASQVTRLSYAIGQAVLDKAPILKGDSMSGIGSGIHPVTTSGSSDVNGLLSYGVRVNGAAGASVRVRIAAAMELEVFGGPSSGSYAQAWARMFMGNNRTYAYTFDKTLELRSSGLKAPTYDRRDYGFDMWFEMTAGDIYSLNMLYSLSTSAWFTSTSYNSTGLYRATAMLDPYFEIHPDDVAKGFSLSFSEGINNLPITPDEPETPAPVPLPAAGVLLGAALLGLGAARRRAA